MLLEDVKRDDVQRAFVRRSEHHERGGTVDMGSQPVGRRHAPAIPGHQAGELELRHCSGEIVSDLPLVLQELRCHHHADRVAAEILRTRVAAAVTIEARYRVGATPLQWPPEHVTVAHDPQYPASPGSAPLGEPINSDWQPRIT